MEAAPLSLARRIVVATLALQPLVFLYAIGTSIGFATFFSFPAPEKEVPALVIIVGCLLLVYPALRGRRWALIASVVIHGLMFAAFSPEFIKAFGRPAVDLRSWVIIMTMITIAATGVIYGVLATRQASGAREPVGFRSPGGGLTGQGAVATNIMVAYVAMVMLATASAAEPPASAAPTTPADETVTVAMKDGRFSPELITVAAGKHTALKLVNQDGMVHSIEVKELGIKAAVGPGKTQVVMVSPKSAGTFAVTCPEPGHTEMGMVAKIEAK